MAKLLIILALCALGAFVKGQKETSTIADSESTTSNPENEALEFSDITLAVIAGRLAAANLPLELEPSGQQILIDASEGLELCSDNLKTTHFIWQYKVCAAAQMRNAIAAINAIQASSQQPPTSAAA